MNLFSPGFINITFFGGGRKQIAIRVQEMAAKRGPFRCQSHSANAREAENQRSGYEQRSLGQRTFVSSWTYFSNRGRQLTVFIGRRGEKINFSNIHEQEGKIFIIKLEEINPRC